MQYLAQADIKVSTRVRYRFLLERHILPHLGHISVSRLTAKELSAFLLHMRSEGRLDGKGGLSAKTVRDIAVLIKTMLRYAQREYHCSCDALTAHLPACTQKQIEVFSEAELAVLGKALSPSDRISTAVMLALYAGLRVGEICALRVGGYRCALWYAFYRPFRSADHAEREIAASGGSSEKRKLGTGHSATP